MALTPGTRLGPYQITAQIGVGGMGEVYRATDTKLKREVAIKVLPSALASDPDRLARFQREAEVLASLNHPNIAAIYGIEEGPAEAGHYVRALVMELVEGPTLAERIRRPEGLRLPDDGGGRPSGLPIDEALAIAKQIAEALEAAHEKGIIHRDLKPANVKVRPDGVVKVLDFGLAKALTPDPVADLSNSPTLSLAMTQAGMILGTAAYMSPEQARGKVVDKRTDIWAFGCVLYEMLTGQRTFPGEDLTDTLAAVVKLDPKWEAFPSDVPQPVRTLLQSCLVKDPRRRVADISTALFVLDKAASLTAPAVTTAVAPATSSAPRGLAWMAFAVAAVLAAAMAVPAVRYLREMPPPETRTEIVTPATDRPTDFALSPDGRQIVFAASGEGGARLWLRSHWRRRRRSRWREPKAPRCPSGRPTVGPLVSFAGGALKRLDLAGGAPQTLTPALNGSGGTWNTGGVILFAPSVNSPVMRVSATGGAVVAVTTLGPQQSYHTAPHFLPDGRRFLFRAGGGSDTAGIYLGALDGSAPTRLTAADSAGVSMPEGPGPTGAFRGGGWLLWVRAGTLVAQRLDVAQAALTGEPVTLADGVGAVSVAATGLVAYRTDANSQRQLTWVDRSGTARGTVGDPDGSLQYPRVSPDGRRVVVSRTVQGNLDLWLLDGTRTSRFTFDPADDRFPVWSPDGTRLVFRSTRTGPGDLYQKLTSGAGVEERLVASDQVKIPTGWSADGRFLMYISVDPQPSADLWVVPMVGDRTPSVFLKTAFYERWGTFSPDGRWVAYQSNESGRNEIYLRPFVPPGAPGTALRLRSGQAAGAAGGQWQVSTAGGVHPVWRPDGKELYYLNPAGAMMAAPITVTGATLEPGAPVVLFPTRIYGGGVDAQVGRQYDVAPDGRFLINTELGNLTAPITLLQHWNPEGKK